MQFQLTINMDNDAFDPFPGAEVSDILNRFTQSLDFIMTISSKGNLLDTNGNTVGSWSVTEGES